VSEEHDIPQLWVPIDATQGWDAIGQRWGTRVGIYSALSQETGHPIVGQKGEGFLDPLAWRWHDMQRRTPAGVADRRLAPQIVLDFAAEYLDSADSEAPFGQPEMFTARNRSTRIVDTAGRVTLGTSLLRIVGSEDRRWSLALAVGAQPLPETAKFGVLDAIDVGDISETFRLGDGSFVTVAPGELDQTDPRFRGAQLVDRRHNTAPATPIPDQGGPTSRAARNHPLGMVYGEHRAALLDTLFAIEAGATLFRSELDNGEIGVLPLRPDFQIAFLRPIPDGQTRDPKAPLEYLRGSLRFLDVKEEDFGKKGGLKKGVGFWLDTSLGGEGSKLTGQDGRIIPIFRDDTPEAPDVVQDLSHVDTRKSQQGAATGKGDKGDPGKDGKDGKAGKDGKDGLRGPPGPAGAPADGGSSQKRNGGAAPCPNDTGGILIGGGGAIGQGGNVHVDPNRPQGTPTGGFVDEPPISFVPQPGGFVNFAPPPSTTGGLSATPGVSGPTSTTGPTSTPGTGAAPTPGTIPAPTSGVGAIGQGGNVRFDPNRPQGPATGGFTSGYPGVTAVPGGLHLGGLPGPGGVMVGGHFIPTDGAALASGVGEFGTRNVANFPALALGQIGGPQDINDWSHLVTLQLRAVQRVVNAAFGGPEYFGGSLDVRHQNTFGNAPVANRIGHEWTAGPGEVLQLGADDTSGLEVVSKLSANGGAIVARDDRPADQMAGDARQGKYSSGVFTVARVYEGTNIQDNRALVWLDNDRAVTGLVDAPLIGTPGGQFGVDHEGGVYSGGDVEVAGGITQGGEDVVSVDDGATEGQVPVADGEGGYTWVDPTAGAVGSGDPLTFGDGRDGDVTLVTNVTLTGPKQYRNLDLNGFKLHTNGWLVQVSETLDASVAGSQVHNGGRDAVSSAGVNLTSGTTGPAAVELGGGGSGGQGKQYNLAGSASQNASAGSAVSTFGGGSGGAGGGGTGAGGGTASDYGTSPRNTADWLHGVVFGAGSPGAWYSIYGGGGGGGGGVGGNGTQNGIFGGDGGAGGGTCGLAARDIIGEPGTATVASVGGNGAAGVDSGGSGVPVDGGAGGGGGVAICLFETATDLSFDCSGGVGGASVNAGGTNGANGSDGAAYAIDLTAGTVTIS
jgi:hypothetical protein